MSLRKHPLLATLISFGIITLPEWLNALWGLFFSEPLGPALGRKLQTMNLLIFSPFWITAPLGLAMFGVVLYQLKRRKDLSFGYAWGLDTQPSLGYDDSTKPRSVQLGIQLVNCTEGPLKYEVTKMNVVIEGRTKDMPLSTNRGGVIPRRASKVFRYPSFQSELPKGKSHLDGKLTATILYGHPDTDFIRVLKRDWQWTIRVGDQPGAAVTVIDESDSEIKK